MRDIIRIVGALVGAYRLSPFTMIGVALCAASVAACARGSELREDHSETAQALASVPPPVGDHGPSAQAISARWLGSGTGPTMVARVQNSTPEGKIVDVGLVGLDPYGREVARNLGRRKIDPHSALDLSIPVRDLPVQSAGHASVIAIAVTHEVDLRFPDGSSKRLSHRVHSSPVYVTFDEQFANASSKTPAEQAKASGAKALNAARGVTKLRHYNPAYNRIDEIAAIPAEGDAALLGITDVAPAPLPGAQVPE